MNMNMNTQDTCTDLNIYRSVLHALVLSLERRSLEKAEEGVIPVFLTQFFIADFSERFSYTFVLRYKRNFKATPVPPYSG